MIVTKKILLISSAGILAISLFSSNSNYVLKLLSELKKGIKPAIPITTAKKPLPKKMDPQIELHLQQVFQSLNTPSPINEASEQITRQQEFKHALTDFEKSKDEEDRLYAVTILGVSQKKEAIKSLILALNDLSPTVRQEAIDRISEWENERQKEKMLLEALNARDQDIVYSALESVNETKNKILLNKIKKLRGSRNRDIAEFAAEVYENLTSN